MPCRRRRQDQIRRLRHGQSRPLKPDTPVAVFDFDGTITTGDTLIGFLAAATGWPTTLRALSKLIPASLVARSRNELKSSLIAHTLKGRSEEQLVEQGRKYGEHLIRARLRPDVVELVRRHKTKGDHIAIASASLLYYIEPVASHLEIDDVFCTQLDVDGRGFLSGKLLGENCRGEEKVRRIEEWYGPVWDRAWCYGNSSGDAAMLARARHGFHVSRTESLLDGSAEQGS